MKIAQLLGENNKTMPEKLHQFSDAPNDIAVSTFLTESDNVEIDMEGVLRRIEGYTSVVTGDIDSLYSDKSTTLFRDGLSIKELMPDDTTRTVETLQVDRPVSFVTVNNEVYYSNGLEKGVISNGVSSSWGLVSPIAIDIGELGYGEMKEGDYLVTSTYSYSNGLESGAMPPFRISLTGISGTGFTVTFAGSWPAGETHLNVYVSAVNGELPLLAKVIEASSNGSSISTSVTVDTDTLRIPIATMNLSEPPYGNILSYYNGSILIATGRDLYYTEPFKPHLVNYSKNFFRFSNIITFIGPTENGVYISTQDEVCYLMGETLEGLRKVDLLDTGVFSGVNAKFEANFASPEQKGDAWAFVTREGMYYAFDGGVITNVTENKFSFPETSGCMYLKEDRGEKHFVIGFDESATPFNTYIVDVFGKITGELESLEGAGS